MQQESPTKLSKSVKKGILEFSKIVDIMTTNQQKQAQILHRKLQAFLDVEVASESICKYCNKPFPSHGPIGNHTRICKKKHLEEEAQLEKIVEEQSIDIYFNDSALNDKKADE